MCLQNFKRSTNKKVIKYFCELLFLLFSNILANHYKQTNYFLKLLKTIKMHNFISISIFVSPIFPSNFPRFLWWTSNLNHPVIHFVQDNQPQNVRKAANCRTNTVYEIPICNAHTVYRQKPYDWSSFSCSSISKLFYSV